MPWKRHILGITVCESKAIPVRDQPGRFCAATDASFSLQEESSSCARKTRSASKLARWLTPRCCSGVEHCSPGLREVVPERSHNNIVDSYGPANGACPGPAVHVGIRHTVLQRTLFTPPDAVPETGLNLPYVAILSIARRACGLGDAPGKVDKGRAVANPHRWCTRRVGRAAEVLIATVEPQIQLRRRVQLEANQRLIGEDGDNCAVRTQGYVAAIRRSVAADAPAAQALYHEVELLGNYRQDDAKAQAAASYRMIGAGEAVAEKPAEQFDFVVAPAGLKGDLGDEIRRPIGRDAGRARGVAKCETAVR